jgi:RNA polymerase sigma factor (sigma-70 family)
MTRTRDSIALTCRRQCALMPMSGRDRRGKGPERRSEGQSAGVVNQSALLGRYRGMSQQTGGERAQADVLDAAEHVVSLTFDMFYVQEIGHLVALAAGLCGRASAEDVAQEAMLATYRRWHEVSQRANPAAFARRVCSNLAVSTFRRRLVEVRAVMRLTDRTWQRSDAEPGEDDAFWSHVGSLPKRQAQAIALRYVYRLEVSEIAETLGISEGSAKVHLHRARLALAARLGTDTEDQR